MAREMPHTVQIGAFTFEVRVNDEYLDKHGVERDESLDGLSEWDKQLISVRNAAEDYMADTLLHEILHMCIRVAGCDINGEAASGFLEDIEERVVKTTTPILLDTLRRNPKLVAYLMKRK